MRVNGAFAVISVLASHRRMLGAGTRHGRRSRLTGKRTISRKRGTRRIPEGKGRTATVKNCMVSPAFVVVYRLFVSSFSGGLGFSMFS